MSRDSLDLTTSITDKLIEGLVFKCTCESVPEQYDVIYDGKKIAYVRLRSSRLIATMPHPDNIKLGPTAWSGKLSRRVGITDMLQPWTIYTHDFYGNFKGEFADDEERFKYLLEIAHHINKRLADAT